MGTAIILALFVQSLDFSAANALDPDLEVMEACKLEMFEDGSITSTPTPSAESTNDPGVDDIAVTLESNGCWVTLEWCNKPGPVGAECTCKGCTLSQCVHHCNALVKKTC